MSDSTVFPVRPAGVCTVPPSAHSGQRESSAGMERRYSAAILPRLLVLLIGLASVKCVLIAGQGQSLYEAHWRIGGVKGSWVNYAAFAGFIVLGGLSLLQLGKCCRSISITCVRALNAVVLLLGLIFIFLTFHNGDKNYIYPILSGVLAWSSVGPYTANSLFFNQPFLAAWLFAYIAAYYVLARTGRENRALFLTAGFACSYGLIYLREFLLLRDELLIIDCFGALSLWLALRTSRTAPPSLFWLIVPWVGWTVFFGAVMMRFDTQWHTHAATYFLGIIGLTVAVFAIATLTIRRWGNPSAWTWFVPFFLVGFVLLTDINYPSSENYNHLFCLGLTFPRYFAGEAALVALLAVCAWLYRKIRPTGGAWWLDIVCLSVLIMACIDLRLSQIMGVRLGWDVLSFGDSPTMMLRMARPYLPSLGFGLVVIGIVYFLAVRMVRILSEPRSPTQRPNVRLQATQPAWLRDDSDLPGCTSRTYAAAAFVVLALLGLAIAQSDKAEGQTIGRLVRSSPWWKRVASRTMSREQFLSSAASLGLGDLAGPRNTVPLEPRRDLNVLVVFMESSYNKHLSLFGSSEETQPLLSKYKDRMEIFPNFFSAFAGSIHARFATFTSLYPVLDFHAFTQERVPVKSLFEVLHDQGCTCSMFYSSYFDYTGFRDFLKNRGLDEMYDADTMPGQRGTERVEWGLLEEETLGAIRNQLHKYAQSHQRFCLTYVPAAPHYPYDKIPKRFQKHKLEELGDFLPLYLNELLYMDWVLASILDELKESGLLEHTLVVITNDHGEMVGGKDGQIGHGWAIRPELANTPLIILDPAHPGFEINRTIGTQVDFLPTVLSRLNIPIPADQLYQGQSLDAGSARQPRRGYLNSYKQFAIVDADKIILGDREGNNSGGADSKRGVFSIGNEGARTVFVEDSDPGKLSDEVAAMARFDAFQENFLRNYSHYCGVVRGSEARLAKRATP